MKKDDLARKTVATPVGIFVSRKWLISVPMLVLLFIPVAVLAVPVAQPLALTDVTFTGRLTDIQFLIGFATGTVQVYDVISGPPLDPEVAIWTAAILECEGTEWDPDLQVNDEVEVHGIYESASSVKVCGTLSLGTTAYLQIQTPQAIRCGFICRMAV